ncbi:tape measure protein [Chitinibacter sp. S2-10]|uniref:tape measure protein n=1 Tax=Chitinibacter sp. S2-10 TaxID=3373597 RepID=UPI003977B976
MAKFELKAVLTAANRISPELKKIMQDVAKVAQKFAGIGKGLGSMAKAALPFAAIGGAAAWAGKSMLDTTAEFEKYSLVLETIEGSSAKAKSSMDWISSFAAKTPYELAGVTDAFVKLKSYGVNPIKGQTLRVLGDTAAAMGKDLNSAVEALADAVTGENERLKEFGITASKSGGQILYSFVDKSGKQRIAKAKANDRQMIQSTLMAIWNDRYSGAMDKLSGSWSGLMSNMQDQFARFSLMVMQSGAFDWLKNKLGGALDRLNQMAASGELQRLAQTVGVRLVQGLKEAWKAATAFADVVLQVKDAVGGWGNLFKLAAAIMAGPLVLAVAQTIGGIFSLGGAIIKFVRVAAILGRALAALRVAAMAFMIFSAANPIVLAVVAAVALLAGAAYLIYKNWEPIKGWFAGVWSGIKSGGEVLWGWIKQAFAFTPLGMLMKNWEPLVAYFKGLWDRIKQFIEPLTSLWKNGPVMGDVQINGDGGNGYGAMRPESLTRQNRPNLVGAGQSRVNGEINVRFDNAPPGMRVDAPAAKRGGVTINPDVGYRSGSSYLTGG